MCCVFSPAESPTLVNKKGSRNIKIIEIIRMIATIIEPVREIIQEERKTMLHRVGSSEKRTVFF